jgi:hypothetical protein
MRKVSHLREKNHRLAASLNQLTCSLEEGNWIFYVMTLYLTFLVRKLRQ